MRKAILRKLPIKCDVMICPAKPIVDLVRNNPLKNEKTDKDRRVFLTVMSEAPAKLPKLPIYFPNKEKWEVGLVWISRTLVLSLWRRLRDNPLYPNQIIEKQFGVKTTTRTWDTIEKIAKVLAET